MTDQDSTQQHHPQPGGDKVGGDKVLGDKVAGDKFGGDKVDHSVSSSQTTTGDHNIQAIHSTINVQQVAPPTPEERAAARLRDALHRLAALPLDTIPDPAPLPAGSRMPLRRNPLFVGRAADLQHLAATVKGGGTA